MHLATYAPWGLAAIGVVLMLVGVSMMVKFLFFTKEEQAVGRRLDDRNWPRAYVAIGDA